MFKEELIHDLSGKQAEISFLPTLPENLGQHSEEQKERALVLLQKTVFIVKKYLDNHFQLKFQDTVDPQFRFISTEEKAEISPIHGIIYISHRYLTKLQELQPIVIHELIHYYADRIFDFSNLDSFIIKGRKLGISIRYTKETGEAVDGFGIFDEVLVMHITKEICEESNVFYFSTSSESYLFEQELVYRYILSQLPITLSLWNERNVLEKTSVNSYDEVLEILKKATFARLQQSSYHYKYRNAGRLLRKLFEEKAIKKKAVATRRREPNENREHYKQRVLEALID